MMFNTNPSGLTSEPRTRYPICRVCLGAAADNMYAMAVRASCKHCMQVAETIRGTLSGRVPDGMVHIPVVPHSLGCKLVRRVPIG